MKVAGGKRRAPTGCKSMRVAPRRGAGCSGISSRWVRLSAGRGFPPATFIGPSGAAASHQIGFHPIENSEEPFSGLDPARECSDTLSTSVGGVLVSTWRIRQRRHAEDGPLASLIIEPKNKS